MAPSCASRRVRAHNDVAYPRRRQPHTRRSSIHAPYFDVGEEEIETMRVNCGESNSGLVAALGEYIFGRSTKIPAVA